jgi:acetyltransferase-like isoleucine patch superfamily enzyme
LYDKKYKKSCHFSGKFLNVNAAGWRWVVSDFRARLLFGKNTKSDFPISPYNTVSGSKNISFHIDDLHNFQGHGKYFQAMNGGKIVIGKGSLIGPNTGLITSNHDFNDLNSHIKGKDITIGENCWIGMNCVILPGVTLMEKTIVAAGSVVNKSFNEGNCIIGGVPAKILKKL